MNEEADPLARIAAVGVVLIVVVIIVLGGALKERGGSAWSKPLPVPPASADPLGAAVYIHSPDNEEDFWGVV